MFKERGSSSKNNKGRCVTIVITTSQVIIRIFYDYYHSIVKFKIIYHTYMYLVS